jgi:NADH-quinone oxidoreductase subunit L
VGIGVAARIWLRDPAIAVRLRERFAPLYQFLVNKWYMDELINTLIVRPVLWFGRLVDTVLEPGVIGTAVTGGTVSVVRAGSAFVRRAQTGFLRYYAAVMILCLSGVAAYFLASSS